MQQGVREIHPFQESFTKTNYKIEIGVDRTAVD